MKWKLKYIALNVIFAFFTNYIFGYTFNDFSDEIKIFNQVNDSDNNTHNATQNDMIILNLHEIPDFFNKLFYITLTFQEKEIYLLYCI